ncbi:patatin-like phospholipase family protein [Brevibacillus sp. SYP-B805]|uniref:patatin-like phospholipase family protein n=1 Tax=Brevibacillus sp. SYP-B805 TaxID=1578199 RepID=UPI0013EE2B4F|nr:patatin-like phospholipase family protein [Brevibacillus sp. SYP-B805]NGQ94734.1 patatin-like phospholipase family protein [Brevibacillus sp. SYP-B805]
MKADAVFEGGGVKGIAFIGALAEMEAAGYEWEKLAGSSAGSIVAALLAAGYSSGEMKEIFTRMNYLRLLKTKGWERLPLVGPAAGLLLRKGLYPGSELEAMVADLLRRKKVRTFGDLPPEKLRVIASDITAGKMLILPDDLASFGIDPHAFPIARAVRMSCTIPYFFQPFLLKHSNMVHYIVDGGLLSNFPVWLFDVPGIPRWPTIGFRLHDQAQENEFTRITGLLSFSKALITTMLEAHDRLYVKKAHAVRTIFIQTLGVKATHFSLPEKVRTDLYQSGQRAARKFLERWDFERYIEVYRKPSTKATFLR